MSIFRMIHCHNSEEKKNLTTDRLDKQMNPGVSIWAFGIILFTATKQ